MPIQHRSTNPLLFVTLLIVIGCNNQQSELQDRMPKKPQFGDWGIETEYFSDTLRPGDNFYQYVNEGWIEIATLPKGYSTYNAPRAVQDRVLNRITELITKQDSTSSRRAERVQSFYQSYMDRTEIENKGLGPIQDDLSTILSIQTYEQVAYWMADPRANSIFYLRVKPPLDMQGGYILSLEQYRVTGLGLPGQIYYLSEDPRYVDVRADYRDYITSTFSAANITDAERRANEVLDLETRFAGIMWDFTQLRDATLSFKNVSVDQLSETAPGFPWTTFFERRGLQDLQELNVGVGAISESASLFRKVPIDAWRSYLAFHWINAHAELMPEPFPRSAFKFFEQRLYEIDEQEPRQRQAIEFVQYHLGADVGALYVEAFFDDRHREQLDTMTYYVREAFRERLLEADWMDTGTRAEAMQKLDAIIFEIGAPEVGPDWSDIELDPQDLVGNYKKILEHGWDEDRRLIGAPITRLGDWNLFPHRIGLGYHQQYNKIFVTAAALEPPFFDPEADPAVNFGSMGQSIAHEFGHALDDQGSKFDSTGALRDWWREEATFRYNERASRLIRQFGEYEVLPDVPLSSGQMIGEIIGDLSGMSVGLRAYEMYAEDTYQGEPPVLDGFTGKQRFFLAAAQQNRTIYTDEALRNQALFASHPPAEFRVNGIVVNLDEWYDAFGVDARDELYIPEGQRVRFW